MNNIMNIKIKCLDCKIEYEVIPTIIMGNHAWYSSSVDFCRNCESPNLSTLSFLHPEDVTIMNKVYPSINELLSDELKAKIPALLVEEISHRYATLGDKYLTDQQHTDGRFVNGMMYTNRVDNCIEEIVDAVFCILGWIFKHSISNGEIPDSSYVALTGLIDIYGLLVAERNDPLA